jgi:hypothetical protein
MSASVRLVGAVLLAGTLGGCARPREDIVTTIEFDGERRTISTANVTCTRFPDGGLVVLVSDGRRHMVRLVLNDARRITALKVGLRHEDLTGFVADPDEMVGTRVDDTYAVRGRMPPNQGEIDSHLFSVETTCPGYRKATPRDTVPALGVP